MDRNLHDDYFERFLRESVEDFRMIPSRRVWTSLYNNLHPGKKWPSLAVCLFLLSAIIFIGLSHADNTTRQSQASPGQSALLIASNGNQANPDALQTSIQTGGTNVNNTNSHVISTVNNGTVPFNKVPRNATAITSNINNQVNNSQYPEKGNRRTASDRKPFGSYNPKGERPDAGYQVITDSQEKQASEIRNAMAQETGLSEDQVAMQDDKKTKPGITSVNPGTDQDNQKEWMEDMALHNKPKQGFRSRLTYQIYATPSVGFRSMNSNIEGKTLPAGMMIGNQGFAAEKEHSIVHAPALNLEAGYSLIYNLNNTFRIKGGMQLNYSNYYVKAQQLDHPMGASMLVNGPDGQLENVYKPSYIANNQSEENARKFSNNSFQLSIPIGADVRLAGNSRFQWFAGATIQPTYVLAGNAFLLSSDMKNYVFDANFVRKWNLNAGFETFISYKVTQGIMLNAGPQFRYQFRSSYIDQYTYDVRMYNLGIKLGIVQQF